MSRLFASFLLMICLFITGCQCTGFKCEPSSQTKVLRHVVLFGWKADTPSQEIEKIEQAFAALPSKIDTIIDFEWGTDMSPEKLAQGYTHCFLVTFADEEGRGVYLPHPEHKKFVSLIQPYVEKVLVIDYWATR